MTNVHLTAQQLANRWSKSAEWVREQAIADNIPGAWKLGRQWRFDLQQIEAYEISQRTTRMFALAPKARKQQQQRRVA